MPVIYYDDWLSQLQKIGKQVVAIFEAYTFLAAFFLDILVFCVRNNKTYYLPCVKEKFKDLR